MGWLEKRVRECLRTRWCTWERAGWCVQEEPSWQAGWVRDLHELLCTFPGVWGERAARIPGARRSILAEGSL